MHRNSVDERIYRVTDKEVRYDRKRYKRKSLRGYRGGRTKQEWAQ